MTEQSFVVLGDPKAQGRPRSFVRGRHAGVYEAKSDKENKGNIRAQIVAQHPEMIPPGVAIRLVVVFNMPRPKGHYGKRGLLPRYERAMHTSKPDLDNLVKAVKDACSGIVWHDDSAVVSTIASKQYADIPATEIKVWQDEDLPSVEEK